jgi:hypothetical protein
MDEREFFDLLDEQPRTPTSLLVHDRGELRSFPIKTAAKAFELRAHGSRGPRFPRLSRAKNLTALLGALLAKEDLDVDRA